MVRMSQFSKLSQSTILLVLLCLSLCFTGCEEPSDPVGTITGTVTSNGEILVPQIRVLAIHAGTTRTRAAMVNDDGKYIIKDIPLGDYKLAVLQKPHFNAVADPFDERIPEKYRSVNTSGFEFKLDEGVHEFDLKLEH